MRVEEKEEAGRQQALAIDRARLEFTQDLAALNAVIEDQKQKLIQFPELAEQVNMFSGRNFLEVTATSEGAVVVSCATASGPCNVHIWRGARAI